MGCNCNKAKDLPNCIDALSIGEVDDSVDYLVIFKLPTGALNVYEGAFLYGNSLLVVTDFQVRLNTTYEIWVTKVSDSNIQNRTDFTIDGQIVNCVNAQFIQTDVSFDYIALSLAE